MTSKRLSIIWVLYGLWPVLLLGQTKDLYSLDASKSFANYLFTKGDLDFAADEYARILHMKPDDDSTLIKLSKIYRRLGQVQQAQRLFVDLRGQAVFGKEILEKEFMRTLLFQGNQKVMDEALSQTKTLSYEDRQRLSVEHAMLQRDWPSAQGLLRDAPDGRWKDVYTKQTNLALAFRPKKPWLASTMSVFLPGSGKVYAKNSKEGITSFLFVAALGYQSFRAFDKRGSKSAAGWIYGSLGLGFYLGNIYGAQQSAKNYNDRNRKELYREVDHIIYRRNQ